MAGVVGVMVVFFAIATLENAARAAQERENEARHAAELEAIRLRAIAERRRTIDDTFTAIASDVAARDLGDLVDVDVADHRLRLREATFDLGSACVVESAREALHAWAPRLRAMLEESGERELFIEGHTDNRPVSSTGSSVLQHCARFDDNYTLSAARAREAREVLVDGWPEEVQARVALAGFGDTRPFDRADRASPANRRVEIFVRDSSDGAGDPTAVSPVPSGP